MIRCVDLTIFGWHHTWPAIQVASLFQVPGGPVDPDVLGDTDVLGDPDVLGDADVLGLPRG